jgi:hypothetical protein
MEFKCKLVITLNPVEVPEVVVDANGDELIIKTASNGLGTHKTDSRLPQFPELKQANASILQQGQSRSGKSLGPDQRSGLIQVQECMLMVAEVLLDQSKVHQAVSQFRVFVAEPEYGRRALQG